MDASYLCAGCGAARRVELAFLARADGGEGSEVSVPLSHLGQLLLLHLWTNVAPSPHMAGTDAAVTTVGGGGGGGELNRCHGSQMHLLT